MQEQLLSGAESRPFYLFPGLAAGLKEITMTDIHEILGKIPVDQIAGLLGTDAASARSAVEAAVPTLLAGMQNNAQKPEGAASLESALSQHQSDLLDGGVDAAQVDTEDGEKIVGHVFGGQQDQVASQLAGVANLGGVGGSLVRKALPILAPIVMAFLAKKLFGGQKPQADNQSGGQSAAQAGGQPGEQGGGLDLGGLLGGLLGGGAAAGAGKGGFGDLLGGLLGGGQQNPQAAENRAPEAANQPRLEPQQGQQGQPMERSVTPGEVVDVDLPAQDAKAQTQEKNDGGLGDMLGGLFGKK